MIRTAALIAALLFFTAQGARAGDVVLAANAVLHNLILIGAFFLDGFASAAEQLCGHAIGARDAPAFSRSVRLSLGWGFGFGVAVTLALLARRPVADRPDDRERGRAARRATISLYAALASVIGTFAFTYDGIYIGATWTRDMRNLMIVTLVLYFATWWLTLPLGNTGLWLAILVFLGVRGALQAVRYPALVRATFTDRPGSAVIAAASRPTASLSASSRPMRMKSSRSVLIAPTSPMPRNTSPE